MEISVLALIGIAVATMFFGYFFGLFEGRGQGYKRGRKEQAMDHLEPVTKAATAAAVRKTESLQGLLLLGLNDAGQPRLHIDGVEVDALRVSPERRRRLIDLMVMLKPWIDPSAGSPSTPASPRGPNRALGTQDRSLEAAPGVPASALGGSATPPIAAANLSLVAQIDAILQARLAGTHLAERAIRLAESLHGGAIVFVGTNQYDGVDKVPDPEIQAAIRAAIAEWEQKYTPG